MSDPTPLTETERETLAAAWHDETGSVVWNSIQSTVARMLAAARAAERERTLDYLRRFPPTDDQRPGIEAALVWLEVQPALARPTDTEPTCRKHGDPLPCGLCEFEDKRDRGDDRE